MASRWVRTARNECLDHIVFMSEDHLRRTIRIFVYHYNTVRPHQGIGNIPIGEWQATTDGEIVCDQELGGLLKSLRRAV